LVNSQSQFNKSFGITGLLGYRKFVWQNRIDFPALVSQTDKAWNGKKKASF
jgi:hypothetical protein